MIGTLAEGVVTVAELEVIEQLERGLPVVDTPLPRPVPARRSPERGTCPTASRSSAATSWSGIG